MSLYFGRDLIGKVTVGGASSSSDSNVFVVTVSWDDNEEMYVPDCTYAEVMAAYTAEKEITVQIDNDIGYGNASVDGGIFENNLRYWVRTRTDLGMTETEFIFSSSGVTQGGSYAYIDTPVNSITITSNDTYDVTNYAEAIVNVSLGASHTSSDLIVSGPTVTAPAGVYASAASANVASGSVTAPSSISGTSATVSTGTNTLTLTKTVSVTPNVTTPGYITSGTAGNSDVSLTASVNTRSSSDLTASGATVTAPAGYYTAAASKSVSSGSATTPVTTITTNPTITVNSSTGLITASNSKTQSVTPTVSPGYISSGTSGTITVSGSNTSQLTVQGAQTIHPSSTNQTISSGRYLTGTQTINAVTTSNLIASNIKSGVTIKIGDASDDDCVMSITGTYTGSGGSSGMQIATASATPATASASISFTNLAGEPTSFVVVSTDSLTTGASPYKTAAVVFDGTELHGQTITNTNNAQVSYDGSGFSKSYSSGTLTVTGTGAYFQANEYVLVYTYGGSSANLGTADVQVGSGATSITFTGLTDEPDYFSCIFKSNFSTSSGYQRVITVVYDGTDIYGMEMDSSAKFSDQHWSYTYNNGSLTISSSGTNAGGYFHQPGYYQLTYGIGGDAPTITTEPLIITSNGTYTAPKGKAYTPVTVNVSGGGSSKAIQINSNAASVRTNGYTSTGISITVEKSGTYKVSWIAWRSSSSGTMGTNLYKNNTAGTNQQTWTNTYGQHITLSNQTYAAGDVLTLYATAGSTSRYCWAGNLIIEEQ